MDLKTAPTTGLKAINLATGFAGVIVGKLLLDLGFDVVCPAPTADDPFVGHYPAYSLLRSQQRETAADLTAEIAGADLCVMGGEDFPGLVRDHPPADALADRHPRLVVCQIGSYHPDMAEAADPAVDLLVQARSGLVFEHYTDRANLMTYMPAQYGAAMQCVTASLAALYAREASGRGQVVSTSFFEGALSWVVPWCATKAPDKRFVLATPMNPRPLILRCKDGDYVHIVLGAAGAKYNLYKLLGIDDPEVLPGDAGIAKPNDPPEKFFGDVDLIGSYVANWNRPELIDALQAAGVTVAEVLEPGEMWDDAQVEHLGFITRLADGRRSVGSPFIVSHVAAGAAPSLQATPLPLAGVQVLDFGAFVAGPSALFPLEQLGADVIKIEPLSGDPSRGLPRAFRASNKGKRGISIDMKAEKGAEVVRRLCAQADIVAHNFRGGVAAKLGIDAATLHTAVPNLIVLDSSPFGPEGPRSRQGAFDLSLQALCGHEFRAGGEGNVPIWNRTFLGDYGGAMLGGIALLAALLHRARTGDGASLDVSLLGAGLFLMSELIQQPDGSFVGADVLNASQTGFKPAECLYEARDGWIAIAIRSDAMASAMARILAIDLGSDWRNWNEADRLRIADAIRPRNSAELLAALRNGGIWSEACRAEMRTRIFDDARMAELGITTTIADPTYGHISVLWRGFRMSESLQRAARREPKLGEHSREVIGELGYSPDAVHDLVLSKVVRVP